MSRKSKGINAERQVIHKFWSVGWAAIRVAGSGSTKYPSPDVLASNNMRIVALECKAINADKKYFPKNEIFELEKFCEIFGAEPWIGVKFDRTDWFFILTKHLEDVGNNFLVKKNMPSSISKTFEKLVNLD